MRFVVPQFIDTEDKIIGPLSTRQFLIFLVGAGLIYVEYRLAEFWLFAVQGVFTLALTGIIAFVKINGQPFHFFVLNIIITFRRPKEKVWQKDVLAFLRMHDERKKPGPPKVMPKGPLSTSKLTELSLVVDTGGSYKSEQT
ncbi:MAG: PrgI family protein [Candidatus Kerfeldbacteria bacterium]|nr:PrgI family protein [Candidatus Kerfeldbacteria bacterium]